VRARCEADEAAFDATVQTIGSATFLPLSKAQACGVARIHAADINLDSFQWCREITLAPETVELNP